MKQYFELRNRENEFVAALILNTSLVNTLAEEIFLSSIEENNWFEDQTILNSLTILKQVAIEYSLTDSVKDVAILEDCDKSIQIAKKNLFKHYTGNENAVISLNKITANHWKNKSLLKIIKCAEETGEQY